MSFDEIPDLTSDLTFFNSAWECVYVRQYILAVRNVINNSIAGGEITDYGIPRT